jgi:hypothetical protein
MLRVEDGEEATTVVIHLDPDPEVVVVVRKPILNCCFNVAILPMLPSVSTPKIYGFTADQLWLATR